MNPILKHLLSGNEHLAWKTYAGLTNHTPEDLRWAGLCLLNRRELVHGLDLLLQAKAKGCQEALIQLATAHRLLGDSQQAQKTLEDIEVEKLDVLNQIFYWRERGVQTLRAGNEAIFALERAWELSLSNETFQPLQAGIAQGLGMSYNSIEAYSKAIYYFSLGLIGIPPGSRARLQIYRAVCHINLGHLEAADQDLNQAKLSAEQAPSVAAFLHYGVGTLARAKQDWQGASMAFGKAAQIAAQCLDSDMEYYAELGAVATATSQQDLELAHLHLARAKRCLPQKTARDLAYLALREGALLCAERQPMGLERLRYATAEFERLALPREAFWGLLHQIEALLHLGETDTADQFLVLAGRTAFASRSQNALLETAGLHLLPQRIAQLPSRHSAHQIALPETVNTSVPTQARIELFTLGKQQLFVDGKTIGLDMTRTIEIIAYLLLNPHSQRQQIIGALFPDTDPKRATDYFHQAKKYLNDNAKVFGIAYFPQQKTYAVHHQTDHFFWDYAELQQILSSQTEDRVMLALEYWGGTFLPHATSTWAESERGNLAWSIAKIGLQTLEKWSVQGEHKKCLLLAEKLLELELDVALAEYMVNATLALDGELAAKRTLVRLQTRFLQDYDEIPPELVKLKQAISLN